MRALAVQKRSGETTIGPSGPVSSARSRSLSAWLLDRQRSHGNRYVQELLAGMVVQGHSANNTLPALEAEPEETDQQPATVPPRVFDVLLSPGQLLDPATRSFMESGFGREFGEVRIHTGEKAAESARALDALAYTLGSDIVLRAAQEATLTQSGGALLAHELAHAAQQDRNIGAELVSKPSDPQEREAEAAARAALTGRGSVVLGGRPAALLARTPAGEIIRNYTRWMDLKEDELGGVLLARAVGGENVFVETVLNDLSLSDRDDVAYEFTRQASAEQLHQLAQSVGGRALLDRVYDELTSGNVAAEEQRQADRILRTKARRISEAEFEAGIETAKIFPFRLPGLTVIHDAPITAKRRSGGRIWVHIPVRVLGTAQFHAETSTLPTEVFISGIELPEDEIVGVRMYDLGGEVHYRPALYLVQLANETTATIAQKAGEAAALGLTFGAGALAGAGAEAGLLARTALWADRAAFALGTITSIINEHRGWILKRFGDDGRSFLGYLDKVNSAVRIYGGVRALIGMGQLVKGLRTSYGRWRDAAARLETTLDDSERQIVQRVSRNTDDLLRNVDRGETGTRPIPGQAAAARPTAVPEATSTAPVQVREPSRAYSAAERVTGPRARKQKRTIGVIETEVGPGVKRRTKSSSAYRTRPGFTGVQPEDVAAHVDDMRRAGVDFELPAAGAKDQLSRGGFKGKHYAGHAEKRLAVARPNQPIEVNHVMCDNCYGFFKAEAKFRNHEQMVIDPFATRVFSPDGTVTEYWKGGSVVTIRPEGTAVAAPGTP